MRKFAILFTTGILAACSKSQTDQWVYSKSHDPVSGTDVSEATRQFYDENNSKSIVEVKLTCDNSVVWVSIGSYYDNDKKDGQLDGDEFSSELTYNLDSVGQASPNNKFDESKFNNEYKYRLDYLIGNSMTIDDGNGVRGVNVFEMMGMSNSTFDILPSSLAIRIGNSHGDHLAQVDMKDDSIVQVAKDCGWVTDKPVRYRLNSNDLKPPRSGASDSSDQAIATASSSAGPGAQALPDRRPAPEGRDATQSDAVAPVEHHDIKELMGDSEK